MVKLQIQIFSKIILLTVRQLLHKYNFFWPIMLFTQFFLISTLKLFSKKFKICFGVGIIFNYSYKINHLVKWFSFFLLKPWAKLLGFLLNGFNSILKKPIELNQSPWNSLYFIHVAFDLAIILPFGKNVTSFTHCILLKREKK